MGLFPVIGLNHVPKRALSAISLPFLGCDRTESRQMLETGSMFDVQVHGMAQTQLPLCDSCEVCCDLRIPLEPVPNWEEIISLSIAL